MSSTETITLVVVSDDHYVILLAALIKSIEENISPGAKIDLWVIEDNVQEDNAVKLKVSVNPQITTIHRKDLRDVMNSALVPKDRSSYPMNIYTRLFIPYFIPEHVEKVLYLDADMIVLADLLRLWRTNISNYAIAAVTDPRVQTFDNHWGGVLNFKDLGLRGDLKYFNTGLLLINVRKWRENKMTEQILDTVNKHIKYANYPDQYGLNIVMADNWLELDGRWNHFAPLPGDAPFIIHFVDRKPIYRSYKNSKIYRDHFFQYLNATAWKNFKPIGEGQRGIKKVKNILRKMIAKDRH